MLQPFILSSLEYLPSSFLSYTNFLYPHYFWVNFRIAIWLCNYSAKNLYVDYHCLQNKSYIEYYIIPDLFLSCSWFPFKFCIYHFYHVSCDAVILHKLWFTKYSMFSIVLCLHKYCFLYPGHNFPSFPNLSLHHFFSKPFITPCPPISSNRYT